MHLSLLSGWKKPIRTIVHVGSLIPILILIVNALTNHLTANPIQAAMQRTGLAAIILLTVMLACTPFAMITYEPYWRSFRKPIGLYAFLYASIHMLLFVVLDFNFNFTRLLGQLIEKPFIWLGVTSFILLSLLALTSLKILKKKMGKNWKRLHRMVYLIAVLVVIHDALSQKANMLQVEGNILQPLILAVIIFFLLILRTTYVKKLLQLI